MSGTYVAWNGQPYPWPPPEGWYQGSDGRWWAPGSGPEPDRTSPTTADEPSDQDSTNAQTEQQTVITKPAQRPLPSHADTVGATAGSGSRSGTASSETAVAETNPDEDARQPGSTRSTNAVLLVSGAATLLLIGAGLVALLNRGDDMSATSAVTTTALVDPPGEPATTLPATSQPGDAADLVTTPPPPTQPGQTTEPPTTQSGQASTVLDGQTPDSSADAAALDTARAEAWRAALAGRGIDTSELSDEDVIDFGKSFCVFAVVSVDAEEFDTYRARAQTGVAGALTEAQLTAAIDTAVVTFCPEDAERLGITL